MRPTGMPAARAADWAAARLRSAMNCMKAWRATARWFAAAKSRTSGLVGSWRAAGQVRQCQRAGSAPNRASWRASKTAWFWRASPSVARKAARASRVAGVGVVEGGVEGLEAEAGGFGPVDEREGFEAARLGAAGDVEAGVEDVEGDAAAEGSRG